MALSDLQTAHTVFDTTVRLKTRLVVRMSYVLLKHNELDGLATSCEYQTKEFRKKLLPCAQLEEEKEVDQEKDGLMTLNLI